MNRDDIIRMAREAGATREHPEMLPNFWTLTNPDLKRFANLVAAAEREACAKVCDDMSGPIEIYNPAYVHYIGCAEAIRARGQSEVS